MNEVIRSMELSGNLSEEQNEALNLHYEIIAKGNLAASAVKYPVLTEKLVKEGFSVCVVCMGKGVQG